MSALRIGTRGSALALWQARHVQERLASLGHAATLHEITTTGDRLQDQRLEAVGTSFSECTARSTSPASSASSISFRKAPLPPTDSSRCSWIRSPVVVIS